MPGIDECLKEAMAVPGARGAWLVDWNSGLALGTAGESPVGDHETTAAETAELARAAAEFDSFTTVAGDTGETEDDDGEPPVEDLIVTTRAGYHILRFVRTSFDSSVFLHLWLDRDTGNLALARIRLGDLAERLVLG
ncbi:roadblock/LC7 domain-containing protein [Streptomyces sp. NPDC056503]|uniref:roadblock/LC7 domain-containing protein n=1 Tax=Streptomyces sp. NPDC056503 TaxID=3345842 RepID=UPI0036A0D1CB